MEALASTMVTVSAHSAGDCLPKASEPFILPLATSTSFRALRGKHFGAYPPIYLCVEEYIVGILFILFTLIPAFLSSLHLPEHQAGELAT